MKKRYLFGMSLLLLFGMKAQAQDQVIEKIIAEETENSQLKELAHELLDGIGPRLVGTPQMQEAHDWAVEKYATWGIPAENQQWGEWRGWDRGITHIDMMEPWVRSLSGMQLAWSPASPKGGATGEVVTLPEVADEAAFKAWLPSVKGKYVMISVPQFTGRPDYNWEEWATDESFEKMKEDRAAFEQAWNKRIEITGLGRRELPQALEDAGALGIITSYWSRGFGANKIFSAYTKSVPTVDLSLEDYGMLYRLAESGKKPVINLNAQSKETGVQPTFNTIAEIKGTEKPDEYVMLSAHFDSWDGGTGATDNGTGTIMMMEVMRVLKKVYPNPKRTILVGHWGSEEQGLNGSRAFVEDHPEIVEKIQALFNQDNGTGRVANVSGQGFVDSYEYLGRWMSEVPRDITRDINTSFPGNPGGGGSDYASFVAAGVPAFSLSSLSWSYFNYTWHTNLDTYDKIVFDDVQNNVIMAAIMVYMACEEPDMVSRERRIPIGRDGKPTSWPAMRSPTRKGGMD
ncbi:M20/M25/M40 family metallo-hydrolase [Algoriphagus zhangzhouensis]|uniref:Carboxypeptidase Q n=1 Tax=Algoriphagus zhangzhouensis TaxID=1073327 RepID=A0A1M7Z9S3_9BACT|nr:M20/M25/M40 family metallo-hydrolase [Algoriphagus zhangzhouensis]TDY47302.1 peptidase M28-like protein [Algoriphagus zhangzhouensis]SHO61687.1 Peptidase family M28 [Algoriphagus zhangzhouensis]